MEDLSSGINMSYGIKQTNTAKTDCHFETDRAGVSKRGLNDVGQGRGLQTTSARKKFNITS
jgi:hypothetical protein